MPNPTTGLANLFLTQAAKKTIEVQVITLDGRVVRETEIGKGRSQAALDISDLPNAMYFVSLRSGDQSVVKKLVLQQ